MELTFDIPADWDLAFIVNQLAARFPEYGVTAHATLRKVTITADTPMTAALLPWIEGAMWGLSQSFFK